MQITAKKVVSIEYTLKDSEGKVVDTSEGGKPLEYLHGAGNIVPGLEKALDGKAVGDTVNVTVPCAEGYGQRDVNAVRNLPLRKLSPDRKVSIGERYRVETPKGPAIATVLSISGDYAKVDTNHPLAGIDLNFSVKIANVRDANAEEIAHGHAHSADGHH